jgi:hypothetical protein
MDNTAWWKPMWNMEGAKRNMDDSNGLAQRGASLTGILGESFNLVNDCHEWARAPSKARISDAEPRRNIAVESRASPFAVAQCSNTGDLTASKRTLTEPYEWAGLRKRQLYPAR